MIDQRLHNTLEKVLGANDPQSLNITKGLANNLGFQERHSCAVELFTRTLKMQETHLWLSHPQSLSTKCGLATTDALQGRIHDSDILLLR